MWAVDLSFETTTKADAKASFGVDVLAQLCTETTVPVVAIGGIGIDNIESVWAASPHSVAVSSAIWTHSDPYVAAQRLCAAPQCYSQMLPLGSHVSNTVKSAVPGEPSMAQISMLFVVSSVVESKSSSPDAPLTSMALPSSKLIITSVQLERLIGMPMPLVSLRFLRPRAIEVPLLGSSW